jgi:adenosine kinase
MYTRHRLLGLCNPLMDVIANVTTEYLEKYGLQTNKAILAGLEHMSIFGELQGQFKPILQPGGAVQNSMRVAQWILQEKDATAIIGAVGDDHFGSELSRILRSEGVTPYYHKKSTASTGSCAVLVHNKERSLVSNPGAARTYHISHLKSIWPTVAAAEMYMSSCFFFRSSLDSLWEVANYAVANNKAFALNLASTPLIHVYSDTILAMFPACDYVFCNESEAQTFSKLTGHGTFEVKELAMEIANFPKTTTRPRVVVITRGAQDTIVAFQGRVYNFPVSKIPRSDIVDTNGAGDAFAGGFLAGALTGKSVKDCVATGNYAAGEIIRQSGCALPQHPPNLVL